MSVAADTSFISRARRFALPVLCSLLLTLAMVRVPVAMDIDPLSAHRALLYETLRLGRTWTDACLTTEGPLAALQIPAYLSGSLWMALAWQIAGNLLLAAVLVASVWRLAWSRRVWALAFLAATLARWPELAPWLVIAILGDDLIRRWDREPLTVIPPALVLGFLGLFSTGHLVFATTAIAITVFTARPPLARVLATAGLLAGATGGWLALGQSLPGLFLWLRRGLALLGQTSPAWRVNDLAPFGAWAVVSAVGLGVVLVRQHGALAGRQRSLPATIFLGVAAWLAWKTVALQAYGTPLVFFGTIGLAGFVLWHHGGRTRWAAALLVLSLAGLARGHPQFLSNALGHFNRQMVYNARQLGDWTRFRNELRGQVSALRNAHFWPVIIRDTQGHTVGADETALPRAMFNNLSLVYPAATHTGPGAPEFVVQGLAGTAGLAPALTDSVAQLALYRNYALQAQEAGFLLWHRQPAASPAPVLVASGTLACGEPLKLPAAPDTAYWVEVGMRPGTLGRVWSLLDELPEAGLIARDERDATVRYALPPGAGPRGFLVDPLIRGNIEFQQWQRGQRPLHTMEITLVVPPAGAWLWSGRWQYRLYAVPGLRVTGESLRPFPGTAFRAFNRPPTGATYTLPFVESPADQEPLLFVHPSSLLEFAVDGT